MWPRRRDEAAIPRRAHAGVELAELLAAHRGVDGVVLGLPRGGVAVAAPIADALDLPLDAYVVRKLGVPGHEELAMGAIASGGVVVWNSDVVDGLHIGQDRRDGVVASRAGRARSDASVSTAATASPWWCAIA